jgi:hypothetical protein
MTPWFTLLYTAFIREHNYWADRFRAEDAQASAEVVFERARGRIIGELQHLLVAELLPAIVGTELAAEFSTYDSFRAAEWQRVRGGQRVETYAEWTEAVARVFHVMYPSTVAFDYGNNRVDHVQLSDALFTPETVLSVGFAPLLRAMTRLPAQRVAPAVSEGFVRNGRMHFHGVSRDCERGRESAVATFSEVSEALLAASVRTFANITSDVNRQRRLAAWYSTCGAQRVDLYMGCVYEDPMIGAAIGRVTAAVLLEQVRSLVYGDPHWFSAPGSGRSADEVASIRNVTLRDILFRAIPDMDCLPEHVLFLASQANRLVCAREPVGGDCPDFVTSDPGADQGVPSVPASHSTAPTAAVSSATPQRAAEATSSLGRAQPTQTVRDTTTRRVPAATSAMPGRSGYAPTPVPSRAEASPTGAWGVGDEDGEVAEGAAAGLVAEESPLQWAVLVTNIVVSVCVLALSVMVLRRSSV